MVELENFLQMKFINLGKNVLEAGQLAHRRNVKKIMLKDLILEAQNSHIIGDLVGGPEPRVMCSLLFILDVTKQNSLSRAEKHSSPFVPK